MQIKWLDKAVEDKQTIQKSPLGAEITSEHTEQLFYCVGQSNHWFAFNISSMSSLCKGVLSSLNSWLFSAESLVGIF